MANVPFIPENAPFNAAQRQWLNGFLAGWLSNANGATPAPSGASAIADAARPLLILFGSQSGTAEAVAKQIGKEAAGKGFTPKVLDLAKHESVDLSQESELLLITSTWGEGEMPDNALPFWEKLSAPDHAPLPQLRYSIFALGDLNYGDTFCKAGRDLDARFADLGATRIHERVDCDVDYTANLRLWLDGVWEKMTPGSLAGLSLPEPAVNVVHEESKTAPVWSRKNPFPARLLTNRKLNAPDSAKDTRHFEISLEGSGLSYEAGDALGVFGENCPELVQDVLNALGCDGEEAVPLPEGADQKEAPLRMALTKFYDLRSPGNALLQAIPGFTELCAPERKDDLKKWLWGREVIDVLLQYPEHRFTATDFVGHLRKLQPRLYSISSSLKAHPGEVHLTVARVAYEFAGRVRKGLCSAFLADRVTPETPLPVFFQVSKHFRVPHDTDLPAIMVGPGTGIAPFRAFLEERQATGAKGKNWLFFGDQKASSDFLYRDELEAMQASGLLTKVDLAFSRDQAEKIYVQTRMLEAAAELWTWLEAGAYFYVCGDASRMAKDVDAALHKIIETAGGKTPEEATAYVNQLKTDKRYARDVY